MSVSTPVPVLCIYTLHPGKDADFLALIARHWPTLRDNGLSTDTPAVLQRSTTRSGDTVIIEEFSWKNERCSALAHQAPAVMAIWEPLGALCSDMKFYHLAPV